MICEGLLLRALLRTEIRLSRFIDIGSSVDGTLYAIRRLCSFNDWEHTLVGIDQIGYRLLQAFR